MIGNGILELYYDNYQDGAEVMIIIIMIIMTNNNKMILQEKPVKLNDYYNCENRHE
jgi:hypothetical protein